MLITQILYLLTLFGTYLFAILFEDRFGILLLAAILIFPVLLFLSLLPTALRLRYAISSESPVRTAGEPISYEIRIQNPSLLPICLCRITLCWENPYLNWQRITHTILYIPGRSTHTIRESFTTPDPGPLTVTLRKAVHYDPIRLFHLTRRKRAEYRFTILPEAHPYTMEVPYAEGSGGESTIFSKIKAGDDPSEIFRLREFQEGDSLRQIHWKLSSKLDTFMVRENSLPLSPRINLIFQPSLPENSKHKPVPSQPKKRRSTSKRRVNPQRRNRMPAPLSRKKHRQNDTKLPITEALEAFISISTELLRREIPHEFYWPNSNGTYLHMEIAHENQLYEAIMQVYDTIPADHLPTDLPPISNAAPRLLISCASAVSIRWEDTYETTD